MKPFEFKNKVAVITGAGSGIGAALADDLAGRGVKLVLADRDADRLAKRRVDLDTLTDVMTVVTDVSDKSQLDHLVAETTARFGQADMLFNNAGIAVGGRFEQVSEDDFETLMDINLNGVIRLTRRFIPLLRQSPDAAIINISSIFGVIAPEGQTAYCTAKFAVRGFSMVLRHELEGSNISVTTVHPGGVNTRIAKDAIIPDDLTPAEIKAAMKQANQNHVMPPEQAAAIILRGVENRKSRVFVGRDAHLLMWFERILPTRYWSMIKNRFPA